jgi:hypothetical protein
MKVSAYDADLFFLMPAPTANYVYRTAKTDFVRRPAHTFTIRSPRPCLTPGSAVPFIYERFRNLPMIYGPRNTDRSKYYRG